MITDYDNDELELQEDDEVLGVDEEIKRNHEDPEEDDFPEVDDAPEEIETPKPNKSLDSLRVVLRDELMKPEYNRNWYKFNYHGEKYTGKVLHEINPNKFVFLIDDSMKGIWINEVTIL